MADLRSLRCSSWGGNEHGAARKRAVMGRFEHVIDLAEWMLLDERAEFDAAVENQIERLRIELRRAAPVAERARVVGHQVRQPHLDLVHGEADHAERRAMIEQAERRFLPGARARAFEDDPLGLPQPALLGERLDRRFELAGSVWRALSVSAARSPAKRASFSSFTSIATTVPPNAPQSARIAADPADAIDDDEVTGRDAGLRHRLIRRRHGIGDDGNVG